MKIQGGSVIVECGSVTEKKKRTKIKLTYFVLLLVNFVNHYGNKKKYFFMANIMHRNLEMVKRPYRNKLSKTKKKKKKKRRRRKKKRIEGLLYKGKCSCSNILQNRAFFYVMDQKKPAHDCLSPTSAD